MQTLGTCMPSMSSNGVRWNRFRPVIHLHGIHRAPMKRDRSGPPQPVPGPKPKQSISNAVLFLEDFCFVVRFLSCCLFLSKLKSEPNSASEILRVPVL